MFKIRQAGEWKEIHDSTKQNLLTSANAGTNITIDTTDPTKPIINATGGGGGASIVEKTYAELKALRDGNTLVAGQWYRITDYVATTTQENTQSANHPFDIIVLATSTNTLNEEARAIQHNGDAYFANSNLTAWKVWYCIDNDTSRFLWADSANGKGVIYCLKDEFENSSWYDWKGIQVKNTNSSDRFYYLFDNSGADASLSPATSFPYVYGNNLGMYVYIDKFLIGCNVFKGTSFKNNTIGNGFAYNTMGDGFYSNTIGNDFSSNTIVNSLYNNTIGNNFSRNTIGGDFRSNTIGNDFSSNTIGNNFHSNTIGNDFAYNTIGNNFHSNTIGNGFGDNTIGDNFITNIIGNYFSENNTTTQTSQPMHCSFPNGVTNTITTSTTLPRLSNATYALDKNGNLFEVKPSEVLTTEPTAAITDGGVHIVYLEAEPTTYYDGYIYLIKE